MRKSLCIFEAFLGVPVHVCCVLLEAMMTDYVSSPLTLILTPGLGTYFDALFNTSITFIIVHYSNLNQGLSA